MFGDAKVLGVGGYAKYYKKTDSVGVLLIKNNDYMACLKLLNSLAIHEKVMPFVEGVRFFDRAIAIETKIVSVFDQMTPEQLAQLHLYLFGYDLKRFDYSEILSLASSTWDDTVLVEDFAKQHGFEPSRLDFSISNGGFCFESKKIVWFDVLWNGNPYWYFDRKKIRELCEQYSIKLTSH